MSVQAVLSDLLRELGETDPDAVFDAFVDWCHKNPRYAAENAGRFRLTTGWVVGHTLRPVCLESDRESPRADLQLRTVIVSPFVRSTTKVADLTWRLREQHWQWYVWAPEQVREGGVPAAQGTSTMRERARVHAEQAAEALGWIVPPDLT